MIVRLLIRMLVWRAPLYAPPADVEVAVEAVEEPWPWRLRDQKVLTGWDHAEMLDLHARVTGAFDEIGAV